MKPSFQEVISLSIQRLGIHGEGVGSWEGFTLFVEGALPGERVRVQVYDVRRNYGRARVLEYIETSPHRIYPPCPVFGRCGGCQLMHLDYTRQLETKSERVKDALQRIGKIEVDVLPCVPSPSPFSYRNKIQLPYSDSRLGLYAFNSHDLVEIDRCYIHCPLGERAFQKIRKILQKSSCKTLRYVLIKTAIATHQVLVILVTEGASKIDSIAEEIKDSMPEIRGVVQNIKEGRSNVVLGKTYRTLRGEGGIRDSICGLTFKVSPASFFQVNPSQAEQLYRTAIHWCGLKGTEVVLDAYCGVGTLSLMLAQKALRVLGVEAVKEAVEDAKENASLNGIVNVDFTWALAEDFIQTIPTIDVAIINPPRKGCEINFLNQLVGLKPQCLIYISCDPATLARDLAMLQAGGYRVDKVQPFDMFPQTMHVETLVKLEIL